MADQNVLKAQKYLNSMYGHRSEWVTLDEDGHTGTLLCQGIIRAFQIENGVTPVTGNIGNLTLNKMRSLATISKMDPNDEPNPNVSILQCALFAKGYAAGGITGIYYNAGVSAVKQYQEDANLQQTGIVDWKVWMGLVSLNWFTQTLSGDSNIVTIQQQLNEDWSDIIGVGPCDGVVSRFTAYALIAALQAAEGIYTTFMGSLDGTNFGNQTTSLFPTVLKRNQNGEYIKYNKLVQYGLYLNGYNPCRFDGIYDGMTEQCVRDFQEFYGLTGINLVNLGEVNVSTMKSLLTSKGDTNRIAKACDCATVLNQQQALDLKNAGYTHVGRYLTGYVGVEQTPKYMTRDEVANIENAGLAVFPIYQDGGYRLEYFENHTQGVVDGERAILAAKRIGIPQGSTIYFAVDFDCYGYQVRQHIIPYFKNVRLAFNSSANTQNYKVGIYGPRYVCSLVSAAGLAVYSFVADMSSGFSCNLGYPIPDNWAFDQFYEMNFASSPSFAIDKDGYSGRDQGFSKFDLVPEKTEEEIWQEEIATLVETERKRYIYNVLNPLGFLDNAIEAGISFDTQIELARFDFPGGTVEIIGEYGTSYTEPRDFECSIPISLDGAGNLSTGFNNGISSITTELSRSEIEEAMRQEFGGYINKLDDIALSVKEGNIIWGMKYTDILSSEFSIKVTSEDVLPENNEVDAAVSVGITIKITLDENGGSQFNELAFSESTYAEGTLAVEVIGVVVLFALLYASGGMSAVLAVFALIATGVGGVISDVT